MERVVTSDQSNWKRTLLLVIGVVLGTFIIREGNAQKLDNSLLWKISGKGIQTSYIYGTFHLLPQADFELKEKVTKAFDASEQIVMELDMDDPNMQMTMMQNIQMTDGTTLDQLLNEENIKILDDQLNAAANLTAQQVNTFKPFMVESFLLPSFIEGTPASYEMTFVQRAMNNEVDIKGLEEVEDQTSIFDEIPYQEQADDLVDILTNRENMKTLFATMIELYKKENIGELYKESKAYFNEQEFDLLLVKRNESWIPKITEMAKEQTTFFAVGAGHLAGDEGILNLLKQAGYKVKPVKD